MNIDCATTKLDLRVAYEKIQTHAWISANNAIEVGTSGWMLRFEIKRPLYLSLSLSFVNK